MFGRAIRFFFAKPLNHANGFDRPEAFYAPSSVSPDNNRQSSAHYSRHDGRTENTFARRIFSHFPVVDAPFPNDSIVLRKWSGALSPRLSIRLWSQLAIRLHSTNPYSSIKLATRHGLFARETIAVYVVPNTSIPLPSNETRFRFYPWEKTDSVRFCRGGNVPRVKRGGGNI